MDAKQVPCNELWLSEYKIHSWYPANIPKQFRTDLILIKPGQREIKVTRMKYSTLCYYIKRVASNKNSLCKTSYYLFSLLYFMSKNSLGHTLFVLRVTHCSLSFAKHEHLHDMTDVKNRAFKLLCYLFVKLE